MSPIEMARAVAVVVFLAVAAYSAARFTWSVTRGRSVAAGVPDLSHAVMGVAMALMVIPAGSVVPAPLGIVVFAVLAAWFAVQLRGGGVLSRAGLPAGGCCAAGIRPLGGPERLAGLGERDRPTRAPGPAAHGGYHLHHLVGCAAMIVMYLTGHGAIAAGDGAATSGVAAADLGGGVAASAAATADAAFAGAAHGGLGGHAAGAPLAAVSWLFGLYFLVAATSLGFRVAESTSRPGAAPAQRFAASAFAVPAPAGLPAARADAARTAPAVARLLTSPAGACASEVALSAGMAVLFFSAL
ncbi:DUF5134 domain-containing protein [Jiangella anatolica]|uniref:DUF5134 domain-containing protein n=1 Tax=Jiangella anatolica TaxID=2670374 RepID=A0A2W2AZP1_9ACTN|nr:DUF5134 domain-containing protein [Jiangella anatolica]PZF80655.1 hypothetical protein C1I92_25030 [Jiangella anatolica]